MGMQSDLPGAYKRVEYLESNGTQYIYTDVPARYGVECCADVMWLAGGDTTLFGGRLASSYRILLIHQYPTNKWAFGYGSSHTGLSKFVFNQKYHVESKAAIGNQFLRIDGDLIYAGTETVSYANNFNLSMFACTYGSASNFSLKASGRIYCLTAKLDGSVALNAIPCIRKSDNKPGMYDTVTNTFYTNAGTGEFIVPA